MNTTTNNTQQTTTTTTTTTNNKMTNTNSNAFVQMVQDASPDVNHQIGILLGLDPAVQGST